MSKLHLWGSDIAYRLYGTVTVRRRPPKHYRHHVTAGKPPVILLGGFTLKWSFLRHIGNRISRAGHPVYIVPALKRNFSSLPGCADLVRAVIDQHDLRSVIIVAHSKGGVLGKYLLIHHNRDNRIKAVIAIAAPFSGSALARIAPHRAFAEMTPGSALLKELATNTTVNKKIISIIPAIDNIVPQPGSYLEGATNLSVNVPGHHRVVFHQEVTNKIMELLNELAAK